MAGIIRETRRHPTDPSQEKWLRVEPVLPAVLKRGRKPKTDLRRVRHVLRCPARSGGGWQFRRFVRLLRFRTSQDVALLVARERAGRKAGGARRILARWIGRVRTA